MNPAMEHPAAVEVEQPVTENTTGVQANSLLEQAMQRPVAEENAAFDLAQRWAAPAADSTFYGDAVTYPQALMKILTGRELGLSPAKSLQSVVIVKGKVGLTGDTIATKLREKGYTWGFLRHDYTGCELAFFRGWNPDGSPRAMMDPATHKQVTVSFTREDAERAELAEPQQPAKNGETKKTSGMYDKYPKSMYFYRCLAFFRRWYAPEVTSGINVYTPDELGMAVGDAGEILPSGQQPSIGLKMPERVAAPQANGQKVVA